MHRVGVPRRGGLWRPVNGRAVSRRSAARPSWQASRNRLRSSASLLSPPHPLHHAPAIASLSRAGANAPRRSRSAPTASLIHLSPGTDGSPPPGRRRTGEKPPRSSRPFDLGRPSSLFKGAEMLQNDTASPYSRFRGREADMRYRARVDLRTIRTIRSYGKRGEGVAISRGLRTRSARVRGCLGARAG